MRQKARRIRDFWNEAPVFPLSPFAGRGEMRDAANLALAQRQSDDDTDNERARFFC